MGRRRKASVAARARAARLAEKPEVTEDNAAEGEEPGELPVVHHKKFGEIRVENGERDDSPLPPIDDIRVPVIVNGCLSKPSTPTSDSEPVIEFEDQTVIEKPGKTFVPEPSILPAMPVRQPTYFPPVSNPTDFMNVLRGIEMLEPGIISAVTQPEMDIPAPVEPPVSLSSVLLPAPLSCVKAEVDDSPSLSPREEISCSPVVGNNCVETDDTEESVQSDRREESQEDSVSRLTDLLPEVCTIRRSSRIKSIGILKQKGRLIGSPPDLEKPVKVKSRWQRSSELEMHTSPRVSIPLLPPCPSHTETLDERQQRLAREKKETQEGLSSFTQISANEYKTEKTSCKETRRMTCDCVLSKEELEKGDMGCGDDCLNRMLFLECGERCALGDRCSNKCFQRREYANCAIFKTEKKGYGLRAVRPIPKNAFIMEYVGEVVDQAEFGRRVKSYAKNDVKHFYFMALKGDTVIDATKRGNISRFINHSCDPNAETQKWTVNGELRIGFFSTKVIKPWEEITFDYRFQRYGKEAQKCYCEAANCRGVIGEDDDDDDDDDEEDDSDDSESNEEEERQEVSVGKSKKQESDMDTESGEDTKPEPKPKAKRGRKPKTPAEKKQGKPCRRKKDDSLVEDLGLEEEIQRLTITGVKNRAHTLMLSRLVVRAEDWPIRCRLLKLIATGDEPCRRLFLDYHGLRFLHAWMQSTATKTLDRWQRRLDILRTLQTLPIPNKTMLIDSKVLEIVEEWSGIKKAVSSKNVSPSELGESEENKVVEEGEVSESALSAFDTCDEGNDPHFQDAKSLMTSLLQSWATLKEVFKIPKKERIEQMKEHEREADREYTQSVMSRENLDSIYSRYKINGREPRERDRERPKEVEKSQNNASPSTSDPDWFLRHHSRKLTKHERRQMFALKVLREEEAARHRMQQEELWSQHKARCTALGLDPNHHPAMDPISGCPIFFDRTSRTWSQTPVYQNFSHTQYSGGFSSMVQTPPPSHVRNPLPYPMISYQYPTPSPSLHMTPVFSPGVRQHSAPANVISLTPDPSAQATAPPKPITKPIPHRTSDGLQLTAVPVNTPMKLPPKWKAAKDSRGFVYYYHIKKRKSQWEPPSWTEEEARVEAQRLLAAEENQESSSESSQTESEGEEQPSFLNEKQGDEKTVIARDKAIKVDVADTTQPEGDSPPDECEAEPAPVHSPSEQPSQSDAVILAPHGQSEETVSAVNVPADKQAKRRREGLVKEHIISPRCESSRTEFKKYKENKLKLKRKKDEKRNVAKAKIKRDKTKSAMKKRRKEKGVTAAAAESSTDKKIKENFKQSIAGSIVHHLNPYRKSDCKIGRITNNDDFKHLARKLTHFVMVKELKHCQSVDDLQCNDSVKAKARDFVRKYMAKFGAEYERQGDS